MLIMYNYNYHNLIVRVPIILINKQQDLIYLFYLPLLLSAIPHIVPNDKFFRISQLKTPKSPRFVLKDRRTFVPTASLSRQDSSRPTATMLHSVTTLDQAMLLTQTLTKKLVLLTAKPSRHSRRSASTVIRF